MLKTGVTLERGMQRVKQIVSLARHNFWTSPYICVFFTGWMIGTLRDSDIEAIVCMVFIAIYQTFATGT